MPIASRAVKMLHTTDPKKQLIDALGDLDSIILPNNQVLIAIYMRPEKTVSGIYLTDKYKDEDKWQGKVGLVVKMGPVAFQDDDNYQFNGFQAEIGDWVMVRPTDGWPFLIGETPCRMVQDADIKGIVSEPDLIY